MQEERCHTIDWDTPNWLILTKLQYSSYSISYVLFGAHCKSDSDSGKMEALDPLGVGVV